MQSILLPVQYTIVVEDQLNGLVDFFDRFGHSDYLVLRVARVVRALSFLDRYHGKPSQKIHCVLVERSALVAQVVVDGYSIPAEHRKFCSHASNRIHVSAFVEGQELFVPTERRSVGKRQTSKHQNSIDAKRDCSHLSLSHSLFFSFSLFLYLSLSVSEVFSTHGNFWSFVLSRDGHRIWSRGFTSTSSRRRRSANGVTTAACLYHLDTCRPNLMQSYSEAWCGPAQDKFVPSPAGVVFLHRRPCPKLEMFFYNCSKVLMTNHGMGFFLNRLEIRAQLP